MKFKTAFVLLGFCMTDCQQQDIEANRRQPFIGRWLPIAFYVGPSNESEKLKAGWNATNQNFAVSFRADGTVYNSLGVVGSNYAYKAIDSRRLQFIYSSSVIDWQYEFRADTLVTTTDCTKQFYCGWKYIRQP